MVKQELSGKIKEFTPKNLQKLNQLMVAALKHQKGELIYVYKDGEIVGGGFFLKTHQTVTYLKGVSIESAKKQGAMYGLMNFAFHHYKSTYHTFDFGGSDIPAVAEFYHKFGAVDQSYYEITRNRLPLWFRLLKKWKND